MKGSDHALGMRKYFSHLDARQDLTHEEKEDYIRKIWNFMVYMTEMQFEKPEYIDE